MVKRFTVFLLINFAGLAIGSIFTSDGVTSTWYRSLEQAPWTPPGWAFGAAWTTIMICFALHMAIGWNADHKRSRLMKLYIAQWILNVTWNPIFFALHYTALGLLTISVLTVIVAYMYLFLRTELKHKSLLLMPYLIWLLVATSLNVYIVLCN